MSQKYLPDLKRCLTHIQMQDQLKILKKIIKGKRQQNNQQPRDPIITQLYVGWQQDIKQKKKRIRTQINFDEKYFKKKQSFREKQFTDIRDHRQLYSKSNQTKFSLKTEAVQQKRRASDLSIFKGQKINTELNKILEVDDDTEKVKNKLSKLVKKVFNQRNTSTSPKEIIIQKPHTTKNKSNLIKKLKLENMKKNVKPLQKHIRQWCQIDILKLRTYFVKLQTNQVSPPKQITPNEHSQFYDKIYVPSKQKIPDFIREYKTLNKQIDVDQLIKDPKFQIIIDGDSLYFGCIQNGKRCQKGVFVCKNYRYQGKWTNDNRHIGFQTTNQGYYKGNFKNDLRHGQGQFCWKNGEKYQGQWKCGMKHGSGIWKSGKGDSYLGQWQNGKVQGYGVHISVTGQRYEGNFKNFLKHGPGVQTFPNGDKFQGQYKNGKPNGFGKYTWKNQIIYQGQFIEGYRHGKGKIIAQKYMKFVGNFLGQKAYGKGQISYENGDSFIGQFRQGERQGLGTLKLKKKHKIISGIWHKNQFGGQVQYQSLKNSRKN